MVLKLSLRNISFCGVFSYFSERLLIFEQMYQQSIEITCIFMKLKPKMYKKMYHPPLKKKCTIGQFLICDRLANGTFFSIFYPFLIRLFKY